MMPETSSITLLMPYSTEVMPYATPTLRTTDTDSTKGPMINEEISGIVVGVTFSVLLITAMSILAICLALLR